MLPGTPVHIMLDDVVFDGTFDGYEDIEVTEDGKVVFVLKDNPRLKMQSGRIVYGFECWWLPKDPNEKSH